VSGEKNQARIIVVCGSSGSGKSLWVKKRVARSRRLVVWDPAGEYYRVGCISIMCARDLVRALCAKSGRFAYVAPTLSHFDFFCRAAYSWGHCDVVAEELADVTTPGKAPAGWGMVVRRGRHQALTVYAVTQRPAESDKTAIGNATLIHCCRLKRDADRVYMAREMGVEKKILDALQPLEFIESDGVNIARGRVSI